MFKNNLFKNKSIIFIILSLILFLPFQNCAKSPNLTFQDSLVLKTMDFFEYRYTKRTPVYFEIQIVPTTSDATNQSYDLLGLAALSDGSIADINYSIEIFGVDHVSICPEQVGILAAGSTLITETCSLAKTKKIGYAVMKVKYLTSDWNTYTKTYN